MHYDKRPVRNANTSIVHGNSLSLEAWGGYHVRRTPFGGELRRLTQEEATRILRLPLAKQEASTALAPTGAAPIVPIPAISDSAGTHSDGPGAISGSQGRVRRGGAAVHGQQAGTGGFRVLSLVAPPDRRSGMPREPTFACSVAMFRSSLRSMTLHLGQQTYGEHTSRAHGRASLQAWSDVTAAWMQQQATGSASISCCLSCSLAIG